MQVDFVWNKACDYLRDVLHADVFSRWIAIIKPLRLDDNRLILGVDNDFYQTWLEENYLSLIVDALQSAGAPPDIVIGFEISPTEDHVFPEPTPARAVKRNRTRNSRSRSSPVRPLLNPQFTFDQFVVGPSNSFAHAAALAVAQVPAKAYNPLFIYGDTGLGKTHLMQGIGHFIYQANTLSNVCYTSSEALLNDYVTSLQDRTLVAFRNKYRNMDVLLIDDIHFLAGKERLQEEFFHTFNALYDARKQIIMTSDRPAAEIAGLEQRLVSRFEWGLVTELESPDFETRLAILRYKQSRAKTTLSDELLMFIAENVKSNVRRLEGALVRAISYAALTRQPLSLQSLRYLLRDALEQEQQDDLKFEDIQRIVAEHFDVRLTDMSSKRRPRSIALPRQVAMFLCRRMTCASLPEIANAFGKTHATVLHACRSIQQRITVEEPLRENVRSITRKLGRDPYAMEI